MPVPAMPDTTVMAGPVVCRPSRPAIERIAGMTMDSPIPSAVKPQTAAAGCPARSPVAKAQPANVTALVTTRTSPQRARNRSPRRRPTAMAMEYAEYPRAASAALVPRSSCR